MASENGSEYVKNLVQNYCPDPSVSNIIRLDTYFKKAHNLFNQALEFLKMGEEQEHHAYIYLMRYCQLVLALQKHNEYNLKKHLSEKQKHEKRVEKVVGKLEALKPRIILAYDKEIENKKAQAETQNTNNEESNAQDQDPLKNQDKSGDVGGSGSTGGGDEEKKTSANEIDPTNNGAEINKALSPKSNLPPKERWNNLALPSPIMNMRMNKNTNTNMTVGRNPNTSTNKTSIMEVFTGQGGIIVPSNLIDDFIKHAKPNTRKDVETCGVLTGRCDIPTNRYIITHVILPKQNGTSNTVHTVNEEELIDVQERRELITLGWIHTHPSQSCFLSSIDMHCQLSYQIMLPHAIAIVYAPNDKTLTFSLTKTGLDVLSQCDRQGFHHHKVEDGLYEPAKHALTSTKHKVQFLDLRKKK